MRSMPHSLTSPRAARTQQVQLLCVFCLVALTHSIPVFRDGEGGMMANRLSLLDGHLPEYQSCEASLAPKFEQLAVHLQNHAHKMDGVTAIEAANRLRADYFDLMSQCVETWRSGDEAAFQEDELESALLQVHQKWGFVKKHIVEPIKKHVI